MVAGDFDASERLNDAVLVTERQPIALRPRYLQTLIRDRSHELRRRSCAGATSQRGSGDREGSRCEDRSAPQFLPG
jgi:hypothetical protein